MNDPALDEPITNAASEANDNLKQKIEHDKDDALSKADEAEDKAYALSTGWWYASTGFPLIAGTFGPMANAFSVCALVENWRVEVPPGGTEAHGIDIRDPRWLIAVNAVSLVCALMANLSLLLNMAKRLRFEIAQPITILGFWVASVLLIGLLSYASTDGFHAPGVQDQALTQAFYYGIFAAGLYQIISYLMCITVWGAYRGAYSKNFELTIAQRTLMLQTISFLVYMLLGALVYCKIEAWKFLDSVFWADFTLLTVGIGGDYVPKTHLGRGLLFPFAIGGIIIIGLVVSSIRSLVLDRGAQKMSARMTEKTRARVVKQIASAERKGHASNKPLFGLSKSIANSLAEDPADDKVDELKRRKTEFEAMRRVQEMASREREYLALGFSSTAFAILWFVGAAVFWKSEEGQQWTYYGSLYFAYTSVLTIGYGDFVPQSNSGKPFFVFWSLLAVPTLTILISNMGDTVVKGIKEGTIWLGEISVLPNSESHAVERLKRGLYKATLGKLSFPSAKKDEENANTAKTIRDEDNDWADIHETHPGLVKLFDSSERRKIDPEAIKALDRRADAWAAAEEGDENKARENKDRRAEAEHHYRRLLVSEITKVYADTKLNTPRKYSYLEWSFYLRLLGEDEADSSIHRKALPKDKTHSVQKKHGRHNTKPNHEDAGSQSNKSEGPDSAAPKWSWIGEHSPLMGGKDEAEWILERLFEKLEESFRALSHEHDRIHEASNDANSDSGDANTAEDHDSTPGEDGSPDETSSHNKILPG
ncbi:hypothetical protein H2198_006807 [Neophaeococcomyces mojaviensis]|uniref:Uncharacterized protein n=1 Tax=Neophaeococcomyces mojaviensis TaxID=3383035 RepID=A0ACC3A1Z3_9EURO|nr:hypothetical protein H2198_006807 [Knufia sp. JES_112]